MDEDHDEIRRGKNPHLIVSRLQKIEEQVMDGDECGRSGYDPPVLVNNQ